MGKTLDEMEMEPEPKLPRTDGINFIEARRAFIQRWGGRESAIGEELDLLILLYIRSVAV